MKNLSRRPLSKAKFMKSSIKIYEKKKQIFFDWMRPFSNIILEAILCNEEFFTFCDMRRLFYLQARRSSEACPHMTQGRAALNVR